MSDQRERAGRGSWDLLKLGGPTVLLVCLAFGLAFYFVDPSPPSRLVLATGEEGGAYAIFGRAYQDRLAAFGIDVELRSSASSRENLELLGAGEADVAFAQSGFGTAPDAPAFESLGSLYFEPLWVFHREGLGASELGDFDGLRLSIGPEGSGTRAIARELLAENGVRGSFLGLSGEKALDALRAGEIDVMFLVASTASPVVQASLRSAEIEPFSFRRGAAYARTHRYLSRIVLPEGMIDYAKNIPRRDIVLVAPAANLVIRSDLHPALVDLLMQSAAEIHGVGGDFEEPGEFPRADFIDLPLNAEPRRYYQHGPPFLQRFLPFWLATLVDRMKVMLIPLVALLIPVFRLFPPLYRWRVRSRIYRWYTELRELDDPIGNPESDATTLEEAAREALRIEREVSEVEAPASYAQELYDLRLHVEFVQRQIAERVGDADARSEVSEEG